MRNDQKILNILSNAKEPVSASSLAFQLGTSDKTALKYLNILKAELEGSGASVEIKQRTGSYLEIQDSDRFSFFMKKFNNDTILEDPQLRKMYVLMRLIVEPDLLNTYEFADELAISPSLLRSIMKELRPILTKYNLRYVHIHHVGYRIEGNEKDIRNCLSKECRSFEVLHNVLMKDDFDIDEQEKVQNIIADVLNTTKISISASNINGLTLHVLIAIYRMETDNPIQVEQTHEILRLKTRPEFYAASLIAKQVNTALHITLPESEIVYLTMHILGKPKKLGHEQVQVSVDDPSTILYNRFLRKIYQETGEDFFEDEDLRTSLLNHIVPFNTRLNSDMLIEKTELKNIKTEYPYAYDLAVTGLTIFNKNGIKIPEAEISFFTLHLQLALEKRKNKDTLQYNLLVYCEDVSNIYQILSFKLNHSFPGEINEIIFATKDDTFEAEDFDLILDASSDPSTKLPISAIHISPYLNEEDIQTIKNALKELSSRFVDVILLRENLFMNMDASNKEDALKQMTKRIKQSISLPGDFLNRVLKREELATTEYDNRVAIPHPLTNDDLPGFVAIGRLNKPIKWKEKQVQLIFLVSGNTKINKWVYDKLARVMTDEKKVRTLLECTDFQSFTLMLDSF